MPEKIAQKFELLDNVFTIYLTFWSQSFSSIGVTLVTGQKT